MSFPNRYAGNCHQCGTYVAKNAGVYDYGVLYCGEPEWVSADSVPEWRFRYTQALQIHDWLREQLANEMLPTRERGLEIISNSPSAFGYSSGGVSGGLDVCPVVFALWNSDEVRAENEVDKSHALAEREKADEANRAKLLANFPSLVTESRVRSIAQVIAKVLGESVEPESMTLAQIRSVSQELRKRIDKREARNDPNCYKCGGTGAYWKMNAYGKHYDDGCYPCHGTGKKPSFRNGDK